MKDFFCKFENRYGFRIVGEPIKLSGGFMHKMYVLHTTEGNFAIKLLNPFVMKRETAMSSFAAAEKLEKMLESRKLPILPALSFDGKKMQEINGQYFYLFNYFEGKALTGKEITCFHCKEMGVALAAIHSTVKKKSDEPIESMQIDWDFYIRELEKSEKPLYELLYANYSLILDSQEKGNRAKKELPQISAVCHNDMDPKNVLWRENDYRIIDLECLSYNNPIMELFESALCWSGYEECEINFELFQAFIQGYKNAGGKLPVDWQVLYDCNNGRLEWLEYNIKRVLGIDCSADEKELGRSQAAETIRHIVYYNIIREQILKKCANIII